MRKALGVAVLLLVAGLLARVILHPPQDITLAQGPHQTYDLSWWTVDGGGGASGGDNYALDGTAGQPDPGPVLSGGDGPPGRHYNLEGGFWGGGLSGVTAFSIYLPLVLRNF